MSGGLAIEACEGITPHAAASRGAMAIVSCRRILVTYRFRDIALSKRHVLIARRKRRNFRYLTAYGGGEVFAAALQPRRRGTPLI